MRPKVHIVVLNWNNWGDTSTSLSSLEHLRYANQKVIVVDNGSVDDSVVRIRERFPWAELVLNGENLGFSKGCNAGIRHALAQDADYVWLLNNDAIADPEALDALVDKAESDPHIGAVGSAIYCMEQPAQLQAWGGGYVNFWLGRGRHFLKPVPDDAVQYLTGASLLIPARVLRTVGLLDEGIFFYWEDCEYCWRLRAAGWKLAVAAGSRIWHKGASSLSRGTRLDTFYNASAVHFFARYAPIPWIPLWMGVLLRAGKRLLRGEWSRVGATWVGFRQGLAEIANVGSGAGNGGDTLQGSAACQSPVQEHSTNSFS